MNKKEPNTAHVESSGQEMEAIQKDEGNIHKRASDIVARLTSSWTLLHNKESEKNVPRFQLSELVLGRVLGRGGFCVVTEIKAVSLLAENETKQANPNDDAKDYSNEIILQDRSFIEAKCIRNGDARYCIKKISAETQKDKERYFKGVIDLAIELKILAVLKHPNIIKMRAVAAGQSFQKDNFIMLDRLYDTLQQRLKKWTKSAEKPWNKLMKKIKQKLFTDRLMIAYDLSSAFKYIHSHKLIYRDLKPENIGFDVRGDVKLFDFGLAKELPCTGSDSENTLYKLSGQTGSLRYMAPEVALGKPYNQKVDVYSFSILLWEMLTLKIPFAGYNVSMHRKMVVESGARPKLYNSLSPNIKGLLSKCWSEKIEERFHIDYANEVLREEAFNDSEVIDGMMDVSSRTQRSL